jgi:N-dimethylarginine dimethylaminohydrolase
MTPLQQTIRMRPPDHFEISYVINPWMEGHFANTNDTYAHRE